MTGSALDFDDYLRALRARLTREQRSATPREMKRLRELWKIADQDYESSRHYQPSGTTIFWAPPPRWELFEAELAPEETPAERSGKNYPGQLVEDVVRQATAAQRQERKLARTLRNELAKQTGATTYAVDTIFRLMRRDLLADAGRKGWLKLDGQVSATPSYIDLHELETRS